MYTKLCRNVCRYCTFAHVPNEAEPAYLSGEEILGIARAGVAAGCKEALFTLGDKPELRYRAARDALQALGCATTLEYVERMAQLVHKETGLLVHLKPGVMSAEEITRLRPVAVSMGLPSMVAILLVTGYVTYIFSQQFLQEALERSGIVQSLALSQALEDALARAGATCFFSPVKSRPPRPWPSISHA